MAAEIELKRINQYVSDLIEITDVVGAYVYGINANGNSVKIAVESIAAKATDYSSAIQQLTNRCNGNAQLIAQLQSALNQKSNAGHQHAISDVNGLNTELTSVKDRLQALEDADLDIDSELSATSENPVQNKVIKTALDAKTTDSDLARVAKTGDFNDLENKPVIRTDFVPQVVDFSEYEPQNGEIVQYVGTDAQYQQGYFYQYNEITIPPTAVGYLNLDNDYPEVPKGVYFFRYLTTEEKQSWVKVSNNIKFCVYTQFRPSSNFKVNGQVFDKPIKFYGKNNNSRNFSISLGIGFEINNIPALSEAVEVGDIVWDELDNLYQITEVVQNSTSNISFKFKLYRKSPLLNEVQFIDLSQEEIDSFFSYDNDFSYSNLVASIKENSTGYPINVIDLTEKLYYSNLNNSLTFGCVVKEVNGKRLLKCVGIGHKVAQAPHEQEEITTIQTQPFQAWTQIDVQPQPEIPEPEPQVIPDLYIDERNMELQLRKNDNVYSGVDLSFLAKDAVLQNAEMVYEAEEGVEIEPPYFKLTFNADSSQPVLRVSLADFLKGIKFDIDAELSETSENAVQNKVITAAIAGLQQDIDDFYLESKLSETSIKGVQNRTITAAINQLQAEIGAKIALVGLQQVEDLDTYKAKTGEIVQYVGETNENYTHGYIYESLVKNITIPVGSEYFVYDNEEYYAYGGVVQYDTYIYTKRTPTEDNSFFIVGEFDTIEVGDYAINNSSAANYERITAINRTTSRINSITLENSDEKTMSGSSTSGGNKQVEFFYSKSGKIFYRVSNMPSIVGELRYSAKEKTYYINTPVPLGSAFGNTSLRTTEEVIIPLKTGESEWQRIDVQPPAEVATYDEQNETLIFTT